jgi:hypothetical protein
MVAGSNSIKTMIQVYICLRFVAQRFINIRDYIRLSNIYCNDHVELFYSYRVVRMFIRRIPSGHPGFDR